MSDKPGQLPDHGVSWSDKAGVKMGRVGKVGKGEPGVVTGPSYVIGPEFIGTRARWSDNTASCAILWHAR